MSSRRMVVTLLVSLLISASVVSPAVGDSFWRTRIVHPPFEAITSESVEQPGCDDPFSLCEPDAFADRDRVRTSIAIERRVPFPDSSQAATSAYASGGLRHELTAPAYTRGILITVSGQLLESSCDVERVSGETEASAEAFLRSEYTDFSFHRSTTTSNLASCRDNGGGESHDLASSGAFSLEQWLDRCASSGDPIRLRLETGIASDAGLTDASAPLRPAGQATVSAELQVESVKVEFMVMKFHGGC